MNRYKIQRLYLNIEVKKNAFEIILEMFHFLSFSQKQSSKANLVVHSMVENEVGRWMIIPSILNI